MKARSYLVAFTVAICGLVVIDLSASAPAANITSAWEVTIHYPPPDGDYQATYVLKQDGEKITGTYHGNVRSSGCGGDRQVGRRGAERDAHHQRRRERGALLRHDLLGDEDERHGDGHQQ